MYQALIPKVPIKNGEPVLDTASPEIVALVQRIKNKQLTDEEKAAVLAYLNAPIQEKRRNRYAVEVDPMAAKMLREELNPVMNAVYTKEDLQTAAAKIRTELPYITEFNY